MSRRNESRKKKDTKPKYCFCKSSNSTGFMIQCDRCDIWFHGKCVGITEREGDKIDNYFCKACTKGAIQCANPDCPMEARGTYQRNLKTCHSKYCSDECGEHFNRVRFEKFFVPKWNKLKADPSMAREKKVIELTELEKDMEKSMATIGRLRQERDEIVRTIDRIKAEAAQLRKEDQASVDRSSEKNLIDDGEDSCEKDQSKDQIKTFCPICGTEQVAEKAFKHWLVCHKKQESQYNYTSDRKFEQRYIADPEPDLYCEKEDKKTKRFCMHIKSACPQHNQWLHDKDEVCACPLNVMQELKPDGNYCLELKSECNQHYNWDRFRLATKDMERLQEFSRYDYLHHKQIQCTLNLYDTYGGVVGIMLHDTKDFRSLAQEGEEKEDVDMIDVN